MIPRLVRKLKEPAASLTLHMWRTPAAPGIVAGTRGLSRRAWVAGSTSGGWRSLAKGGRAVPSVGFAVPGNLGSFDVDDPRPASLRRRLLRTVAYFGAAFAVDLWSGRRYSPFLGGAAIYGSALTLFPSIRPGLVAASAHTTIWTTFNVVRAYADDAGLGIADQRVVSDVERWLFGGSLPSSALQRQFFDASQIMPRDIALGIVHASFFVVPHAIGALVWHKRRDVFGRYQKATALCFAVSLGAFLLLPTAPPWMSEPDHVTRITHDIVTRAFSGSGSAWREGSDAAFWFEPNAVAALPSVHVAAAVLVALAPGSFSGWVKVAGGSYVAAMSVAVVYLGEHFVLDVVTGWLVALVAWRVAHPQSLPNS